MAKNLKLQIKNTQLAEAINISGLKAKLSKKKADDESEEGLMHGSDKEMGEEGKVEKTSGARQKAQKQSSGRQKKTEAEESHAVQTVEKKKKTAKSSDVVEVEKSEEVAVIASEEPIFSTLKEDELKFQQEREVLAVQKQEEPIHREEVAEQKAPEIAVQPEALVKTGFIPASPMAQKRAEERLGPVLDRPMRPAPVRPAPVRNDRPPAQEGARAPFQKTGGLRSGGTERRSGPEGFTGSRGYQSRERPFSEERRPSARPQVSREGAREGVREAQPQGRFDTPRRAPSEGPYRPQGGPSSAHGHAPYRGPSHAGDRPPRPMSSRPGGPSTAPRRPLSGGFRPQQFGPRPHQEAPARQDVAWEAPQGKEGADERAQQRRQSISVTEDKKAKFKDTKESKTAFKKSEDRDFDSRLRHGFHPSGEDEDEQASGRRKRRPLKGQIREKVELQEPTRPTKIKVRLPISVKDLAQEMKLKAAQLIGKLFLQGIIVTLNDLLDDETIVQLLGHEFGCDVAIDTSEQERLKLSGNSIQEEISKEQPESLITRPPVVAFMGHVDHGKTSLIDAIRKTNRVQDEVGAITQHIGAFSCTTSHGPVTILDTPGHEAFSAMRERGAQITDIIVLVIAGDEGIKEQTVEALNQAKASGSTIVVALNKCDKPAFDQEKVYRQLADRELLPEAWGGQTITVPCSALTGEGIQSLLEMIAIQSEVLELQANPQARARGTVIESEMHKGLGPVATVLVQNGTLRAGDCVVFDFNWAKIKSMKDDMGHDVTVAGPSASVRINGLSGFPNAGEEFVVVASEKEAKAISEARQEGRRQLAFQTKKKFSLESMAEKSSSQKKFMNVILKADVQGSLEALKIALLKIQSQKVELNVVTTGVGEISESDVQLANASKATIIGFHTQVESHAEPMMRELGVRCRLYDIIYRAQDDVRDMMKAMLDKIAQETDVGKAEVKTMFKSSQLGMIAGCQIMDGSITRNCFVRVMRGGTLVWKGSIASLKRFKDDVREVSKGNECGILLNGFSDCQVGDILEGYEVTYLVQDL